MKIPILNDLHGEVNRLLIAGAKFATNDPRISKHLPMLTKMGERAPAIKKLAEMTHDLLTTNEPEAALTDLGVFLTSILSTQGDTNAELEEAAFDPIITSPPQTTATYSTLRPVITALSTIGSNRYETLEAAFKEGNLQDFRVYPYLSKGLGDKYAPIATYYMMKSSRPLVRGWFRFCCKTLM